MTGCEMALNMLADSRDVKFVLFELLQVQNLTQYEKFSAFDKDVFESVIELAEVLSVKNVYPCNSEGDKIGVSFDPVTKEVKVPPCYKEAKRVLNEAGFSGLEQDPQWGGMGMPNVIYRSVLEYLFAGSVAFTMYTTLSTGAANLVSHYGSDELKKMFLGKMVSGEWGGTMCLTEPEAGSDVGALKAKAVKQDDGTYLITGQKIFISSGDNDMFENMIHPVLARIEGDPQGTKGISIFIVPKFLVNSDGSIGGKNDLVCSGIEHKMGIKGSATCTMSFGDNGRCTGYLLGEERQGMKIMFAMMNEARLDVAIEGLGAAGSAYMHALTYSRNRIQGYDPSDPSKQTVIMNHPDVKRMLLWMKSNVEAMRMVSMFAAWCFDISNSADGEEKREAAALLEFLIPICKAGNTDLAWLITSEAIQVYGGYGYCLDYPVEQLARDSKILAIYEGTNGIQSIDLTMRKLLLNPDMYNYKVLKKQIKAAIESAVAIVDKKYCSELKKGVEKMDSLVTYLSGLNSEKRMGEILASAVPLQNSCRMLVHAWLHLRSMDLSLNALKKLCGSSDFSKAAELAKENREIAFYCGKVLSARYYVGSEFKKFEGLVNSILSGETAVVDSFDELFTGALLE